MESWRLTFDSPLSSLIKSNVMRRLVAATPRDRHLDNVARMSVISCAYHVEFVFPSGSCPKLGHRREGIFKAKVGQTRRTAHCTGREARPRALPLLAVAVACNAGLQLEGIWLARLRITTKQHLGSRSSMGLFLRTIK